MLAGDVPANSQTELSVIFKLLETAHNLGPCELALAANLQRFVRALFADHIEVIDPELLPVRFEAVLCEKIIGGEILPHVFAGFANSAQRHAGVPSGGDNGEFDELQI